MNNQINFNQSTGADESFINITEPSGKYTLELSSNKPEAKWYVKFAGHPTPTLVWRDPHGHEIPWRELEYPDQKYEATRDRVSTTLKIRIPRISDSGVYTLFASNGKLEKEKQFTLYVRGNDTFHSFRWILRSILMTEY